ncbi:MAG TPA: dihydroorotate dehydrogenase-like protein [Propionibacteriaceae bacterium]|nr:dihydroorotate dehydrogenase-like protein [Propionibacteriaceae bacterium]
MDLSTTYLGLKLPHPVMPGASPMVDHLDLVKRLEDAGAAAITMHSLFEEQITREQQGMVYHMELLDHGNAEALSYFPQAGEFRLGPYQYLEQVRLVKQTVALPVIGSLNGTTSEGWLEYAKLIEQAGADALELNVYHVAADPAESGDAVEQRVIDIVREVKSTVTVPVAVKLSPFYSSVAHLAARLDAAGVDGLVLFNRFYQPDIDLQELAITSQLSLSRSQDLLLRLRWIAVLYGRLKATMAVTGGVHTAADALKSVMAGASAVQTVSSLLLNGPEHIKVIVDGMRAWLEEHEYESLAQARGSMSLERSPNPAAFERANYMKVLAAYQMKIA